MTFGRSCCRAIMLQQPAVERRQAGLGQRPRHHVQPVLRGTGLLADTAIGAVICSSSTVSPCARPRDPRPALPDRLQHLHHRQRLLAR